MTPETRPGTAARPPIAGEAASAGTPKDGRSLSWLYYVVLPVLFVLVWSLLTDVMAVFPGALLPSPLKVANAFVRSIASGELTDNIAASLQRIFYADLSALALGVPIGLAMGLYQRIEKLRVRAATGIDEVLQITTVRSMSKPPRGSSIVAKSEIVSSTSPARSPQAT